MLVIVAGLPGAGKTTLSTDLARALKCAVLGVDQAEVAIWRAGIQPGPETHDGAYSVVDALAAEELALDHTVIIDAVTGPEVARLRWRRLAGRLGSRLRFIVVDCSDEDLSRERLRNRQRRIDGLPEPTWDGILRRRAEFPAWVDLHLAIDTASSRAANLEASLAYVNMAEPD